MNKEDLIKECLRIRNKYSNNIPLDDKDKNWMLEEIFKHHPNWNKRDNKPIKDVIIKNDWTLHNNRSFYIVYDDNSCDHIAFRWCILNKK